MRKGYPLRLTVLEKAERFSKRGRRQDQRFHVRRTGSMRSNLRCSRCFHPDVVVPNCWPVETWQLKTKKHKVRIYKGIYHVGGENALGVILCGDFERHFTEEERELARSHEQVREGTRVSAFHDHLAAQVALTSKLGVGDERPTYVFAGAAKKIKVQNSEDTDSSLDWVAKGVLEMDEVKKTETPKERPRRKRQKREQNPRLLCRVLRRSVKQLRLWRRHRRPRTRRLKKSFNLSISAATADKFCDAACREDPRCVSRLCAMKKGSNSARMTRS